MKINVSRKFSNLVFCKKSKALNSHCQCEKIILIGSKTMAYTKPQVIAQNASTGSYAAGCPAGIGGSGAQCHHCERYM